MVVCIDRVRTVNAPPLTRTLKCRRHLTTDPIHNSNQSIRPYTSIITTTTQTALVGETLEAGGAITGARVVDKSKNRRPEYRLEVWTRSKVRCIVYCVLCRGGGFGCWIARVYRPIYNHDQRRTRP